MMSSCTLNQPTYLSICHLSINLPDISIDYLSHNNQLVSSLWYVDVAEVLPREWHDERFVPEQLQSKESDHAHPGREHQPHHPTTQDEPVMSHNSPLSITGSATEAYIVVHRKLLSYTNFQCVAEARRPGCGSLAAYEYSHETLAGMQTRDRLSADNNWLHSAYSTISGNIEKQQT